MAKRAQMNTSGPNGGRGNNKQASVQGSTARTTGYAQTGGVNRGDQKQIASRGLDGQRPMTSRAVPRQAAVNRGPFSDFSTSRQNLGRTKPPMPKYNKNAAQPRAMQNSMKGKGTPAG